MEILKTGRSVTFSPFSLEEDLYFNAEYFLSDMEVEPMRISPPPTPTLRMEPNMSNLFKKPILTDLQNGIKQQQMIHAGANNTSSPMNKRMMYNSMQQQQQQHNMLNGDQSSYEKLARTFQNLYSSHNGPHSSMHISSLNNSGGLSNSNGNNGNGLSSSMNNDDDQFEKKQFKLPSSKSPIMEALVYCSINKYGIELKELNSSSQKISFLVSDFNTYYKNSCQICSKQSPSEDIRARMKALQRWFTSFPAWRELEKPFELVVRPSHYMKMHEIITKMVRFYSETATDI